MIDAILAAISSLTGSYSTLVIGVVVVVIGLLLAKRFVGGVARWIIGLGILLTANGVISVATWQLAGTSVISWVQTNVLQGQGIIEFGNSIIIWIQTNLNPQGFIESLIAKL